MCEKALLNGKTTNLSLGPLLEADVYTDASGRCAAFLSNSGNETDRIVQFRNMTFNLPAWSVSILPDCKNVEFNSAKVRSQSSVVDMVPEELQSSVLLPNRDLKALQWEVFVEKPGMWGEPDVGITGFVDQINSTKDTTDYMWLTTSLYLDSKEILLENDSSPVLSLKSNGHALYVFVNRELQGTSHGVRFTAEIPISLEAGKNEIALLSMTVGLRGAGSFMNGMKQARLVLKFKVLKTELLICLRLPGSTRLD